MKITNRNETTFVESEWLEPRRLGHGKDAPSAIADTLETLRRDAQKVMHSLQWVRAALGEMDMSSFDDGETVAPDALERMVRDAHSDAEELHENFKTLPALVGFEKPLEDEQPEELTQ